MSSLAEVTIETGKAARAARYRAKKRAALGIVPPQNGWGHFKWADLERERADREFPKIKELAAAPRLDPPPATQCQWPLKLGPQAGKPPLFCGAPVLMRGCSYCANHAVVAYASTNTA